jgi:hypothetical protein
MYMSLLERNVGFFPGSRTGVLAGEGNLLRTAESAGEHIALLDYVLSEYSLYRRWEEPATENPMNLVRLPFAKQLSFIKMCSPMHDDVISRSAGNGTVALGQEINQ